MEKPQKYSFEILALKALEITYRAHYFFVVIMSTLAKVLF